MKYVIKVDSRYLKPVDSLGFFGSLEEAAKFKCVSDAMVEADMLSVFTVLGVKKMLFGKWYEADSGVLVDQRFEKE